MVYYLLDEEDNLENAQIPETSISTASQQDLFSKFTQQLKNALTQYASGAVTGLGGSYGDVLDLLGLQSQKNMTEAEEARYRREHAYSPEQLAAVGTEDDILPSYSRLPSSEQVQTWQREAGVPAPTGLTGKAAQRIGQLTGAGAAFGQLGLKGPFAAGAVGQTLEEAGAPKWVQAVGEIAAFIKTAPKGMPVASRNKEINRRLGELRKTGAFDEKDITLAKNALEERGWLKKSSRFGAESEKAFEGFVKNAEQGIKEAYEKGLPGLKEGGIEKLERVTNDLMNEVQNSARNLKITNSEPLRSSIEKARKSLSRTIASPEEEKKVLTFFDDALEFLSKNPQFEGDYAVEFYRKINKSLGNWIDPSRKEVILADVKDGIKEMFKAQGTEGKVFNKYFESGNKAYMKWLKAEKAVEYLDSVMLPEGGINFKKLNNIINDPKKLATLEQGVGKEAAQSVRRIAETAVDVEKLQKIMRGGLVKDALKGGKLFSLATAITTGNMGPLKTYVGAEVLASLSEKLLTDPSWQNLRAKLMKAIKSQSPQSIAAAARSIEKRFDEEINQIDRPSERSTRKYTLLED